MAHPDPTACRAEDSPLSVADEVERIDQLWTRLQHVCWEQQSLSILVNLARDLEHHTGRCDNPKLHAAAHRFRAYLGEHLELDRPLTGEQGDRVGALIDLLKDVARPTGHVRLVQSHNPRIQTEIRVGLIAHDRDFAAAVGQELEQAGYCVQTYTSVDEAATAISTQAPAALVAELPHHSNDPLSIARMGAVLADVEATVPVIYISERGDLSARLEAVRNRGQAFFVRPVNVELILSQVRVLTGRSEREPRVLVVGDQASRMKRICQALEEVHMQAIPLEQPPYLLSAIQRTLPDSVVLDLTMTNPRPIQAIRVLRQHQTEIGQIPILCIGPETDRAGRLAALNAGADMVLDDDRDLEALLVTIRSRAKRKRVHRANEAATSATAGVEHLGNRQRFLANVEQALQGVGIQSSAVAVLLISVDNYRALREQAGMYGCDRIMMQLSRRIGGLLREDDKLLRHSDSSFAVLACELQGAKLEGFAATLSNSVERQPFKLASEPLKVSVSLGVVVTTHAHSAPLTLVENADLAARIARDKLARIHIHNAVSDRSAEEARDQAVARQVREALDKYRHRLLFQPIVSLGNDEHERYEAFLRMQDAAGKDIYPGTIFQVANQKGFASRIDRVVVGEALKLMHERKADGHVTQLMVSICAATMGNPGFPKWLGEQVARYQLAAGELVLKVSEASVLDDLPTATQFADSVRAAGCHTAIRLTRLNRERLELLSRLAPQFIQLDHHLIPGLANTLESDTGFHAVVESATSHEIKVIVSHVEDPKTLSGLWRRGVNFAQGNFLQEAFPEMSYDFDSI